MNQHINYYLNALKRICPELTPLELEQFAEGLTVTTLDKNEFYIKSGEIQPYNGFIIKGLVREFYTNEEGNERNLEFLAENQYACDYPSFMEQTPSPFSYQCLEPTIFINIPMGHIEMAYQTIPTFERYGRLAMEQNVKQQQQRIIRLLSKNAEQRYLLFIEQYPQLFQRISISHLCSYLGVERQTLTRIRKKLAHSDKK